MNLVLEACAHGVTSWACGRTFEKRAVVGTAVHIADTAEFTLSHTLSVMHDKKGLRQQTETSMRPDSAPSGNGWMSGPIEPSEKPASCADTIQNQQLERPGATVAAAPPHLRQHHDPRPSMRCLSQQPYPLRDDGGRQQKTTPLGSQLQGAGDGGRAHLGAPHDVQHDALRSHDEHGRSVVVCR